MNKLSTTVSCVVLASGLACSTASAAEFGVDVSAGVGITDNVGRRATDEVDETIANLGLRFSIDERTSRLFADVVGDLGYYEYLDDTFDSELLGNVAANVRVALWQERVYWLVTDNFGQVLLDPFTPATPLNRENFNYFATGPEATFRLGGGPLRLNLGAQYFQNSYEESPLSSDGQVAHAGVAYAFSDRASLGLNARVLGLEYDEQALNGDYDQDEIFLRFDAEGARTRLIIDAGYTELDQDSAADTESGMLLRADLTRRMTSRSTLTFSGGRQFSNSGLAYSSAQAGAPIGLETVTGRQTVDPFTSTHATLAWNMEYGRMGFELSTSLRDESFERRPEFDQRMTAFGADVRRDLTPTLDISFRATQRAAKFEVPGGDYDELAAGLVLNWRMSRSLALRISQEYAKRDSDVASAGYTENRTWLSLAWNSGVPRSTALNGLERNRSSQEAN